MGVRRHILGFAAATGAALSIGWSIRHLFAPAVRAWQPGHGEFVRAGRLTVRVAGGGDRAFILLHGLVSSGETFGSEYDHLAAHGHLIVPDLLGFSRSMSDDAAGFSLGHHLDSLDEMAEGLGIANVKLVIAGHSLGALIALHWAARRSQQVDAVVTFGAPLFRDQTEARRQLKAMGALESLFAQDSPFASRACALMCAHRKLARFLAVALSPDLPIAVSSRAVLHTWPAYREALSIFFSDWAAAIRELEQQRTRITLIAGDHDRAQVNGLADSLAAESVCVSVVHVREAAHILPITHGALCAEQLMRYRFA